MNTLKQLNVIRHLIDDDGSCLYHAVAHQAGFIPKSSRGDRVTSNFLRQTVSKIMDEFPHVRMEDGLSHIHWLEKKQAVLDPSEWGGDLEFCLPAIGLKRDIVMIILLAYCQCWFQNWWPWRSYCSIGEDSGTLCDSTRFFTCKRLAWAVQATYKAVHTADEESPKRIAWWNCIPLVI